MLSTLPSIFRKLLEHVTPIIITAAIAKGSQTSLFRKPRINTMMIQRKIPMTVPETKNIFL